MRVHIDKTALSFVSLVALVVVIIGLSHLSRTLSPAQIAMLLTYLPGQSTSDKLDQTVRLPNGYRLSTKSNSDRFALLSKTGKEVEMDLAAFDISLATQAFSYPNNLDFPSEEKPQHIVIRLVDEPQPWYSLFEVETSTEIGSLNVVAHTESVEVSIYLTPRESLELTSLMANRFALYALYALTHAWPTDSAQMISRVNKQIVEYYGHQGHAPTFYVE